MGWVPDHGAAIAMLVVSVIGWGSWTTSMKFARINDSILSLFLLDYSIGILCIAVAACFSLGWVRAPQDNTTSVENIAHAELVSIACAFAAGLLWNVANTLAVVGINLAGMAVAFPIVGGCSLILGTVLTYVVQPTADPCFLFSGVGTGVLAVFAMGASHRFKTAAEVSKRGPTNSSSSSTTTNLAAVTSSPGAANKTDGERPLLLNEVGGDEDAESAPGQQQQQQQHQHQHQQQHRRRATMAIVASAVGGGMLGMWSPLCARAQAHGQLSPYVGACLRVSRACVLL
jgi:hypothetical protein